MSGSISTKYNENVEQGGGFTWEPGKHVVYCPSNHRMFQLRGTSGACTSIARFSRGGDLTFWLRIPATMACCQIELNAKEKLLLATCYYWITLSSHWRTKEPLNFPIHQGQELHKLYQVTPFGTIDTRAESFFGVGTVLWTVGWGVASRASTHTMPVAPCSTHEANMSLDIARCALEDTMSPVENQWVRRTLSSRATSSKAEELGSVRLRTQKEDISSILCRKVRFLQMGSCDISTIVHIKTTRGDSEAPYVQAIPPTAKPGSLGAALGHQYFWNLSIWAQTTAKVANHWSSTFYSSMVVHCSAASASS